MALVVKDRVKETSTTTGMSVGPVTVSGGVTVTVPSGQTWLVL